MPESPTIAQVMETYAADAVVHAQGLGSTLDFSESSLVEVEAILSHITKDGLIDVDSLTPEESENVWILSKMYGGYVGEVIIRHIGAIWRSKDGEDNSLIIELYIRDRLTGSPPERVWKRLTQSEFDSIIGYYRGLQHILGLPLINPLEPSQPWYRKLINRPTR